MRRLIAVLLFAALLALIYVKLIRDFDSASLEKVELTIPDSIRLDTSRGYLIPQTQSLQYTLSQSPRKLWISSAAILDGNNNKTARYPYELDITVFDKNDMPLFNRAFHFQSSAAKLVELKDGGQILPEIFLASLSNKLSASKNIHIKLPEGATRLVVKKVVESRQIKGLAIRAYQYVQRSSRVNPIALWERLSYKQRAQLTENFPFEDTFISDEERGNLVEFRWQPLVPGGDEGDDYSSVLLYRIPRSDIAVKKHLLSQYEHHTDAYKRVSFPIAIKGRYRLEGKHAFNARDFDVFMEWFNANDSWSKSKTLSFNGTSFVAELELDPGLVTFLSSVPLSLDLFAETGFLEEHDHFSQAMLLLPGKEVNYTIEHSGSAATPILIKSRAFAEQELATEGVATLNMSQVQQGEVLETTKISVPNMPEENSQLVNEEFFNWLGVASDHYVSVPSKVQKITLSSDQPLLVSLYTRLGTLPSIRVFPEEKRDWYDYPSGVPDWFAVRPDNQAQLINEGYIRVLKHHHRSLLAERDSPEPDESYQSLISDFNNLTLLDLMVENPYPGQPTSVEENTDLNFAPVSLTPNSSLSEQAQQAHKPAKRRLFFTKEDDSPQQINWKRKQQTLPFFWVAGKWGIVDEIATGRLIDGELEFALDAGQWWRNGVGREDAQWQQRRGLLFDSGQNVSVTVSKKQEKEILSFVVYTTGETPVILQVKVSGLQRDPNITDVHTILNRQYQIQPVARYRGFQLSGVREISGRQSFSMVLDKDLLLGDYQLSLTQLQGEEIFLSLVKRALKPVPIIERYRTQGEH